VSLPATADDIWPYIEKWPFAVVGFVTPSGEPRAAGVMYKVRDRVLNVLTGPDTWKVRHIKANPNVVVTVTVQRLPIRIRQAPPAVITFPGHATVVPIGEVEADLRADLLRGVDPTTLETCVIRIEPIGRFVTYGIGVPLMKMRHPEESLARVPVG
jgi:hypothetical protein